MSKSKKQILYPTLVMVLFTAILTGILAYVNELTRDRIQTLEEVKIQSAILRVLQIDSIANDPTSIQSTYNEAIREVPFNGTTAYVAKQDGKTLGVAFEMKGNALWGSVTGYFALTPKGDKILGVDFIAHSETPGLGGRIDESWYKKQYVNLPVTPGVYNTAIYRPQTGGNVDTITGATLTSNAIIDMINEAVSNESAALKEASL